MTSWLEKNSAALIAIASTALGALYAGARILWDRLVEKPNARIAALETELKAEQREHWKTAVALASLQGKLARERGASSSPPPT